jgi:hypothetical protein
MNIELEATFSFIDGRQALEARGVVSLASVPRIGEMVDFGTDWPGCLSVTHVIHPFGGGPTRCTLDATGVVFGVGGYAATEALLRTVGFEFFSRLI